MRASPLLVCLYAAACVVFAGTARPKAQDTPNPDVEPPVEASPAPLPPWPTMDVIDLWHKWRPKPERAEQNPESAAAPPRDHFFVVAPAIGSKPSTGLTLGLNGNMAFYQGDERSTHISTVAGGFRVSQKKQVLSNVRFSVFTQDDRWFLSGDNRLNWTSLNTYELGTDATTADAANVKYNFVRLYETAYRTVKPGLFMGGGFNVNVRGSIRPGDNETGFDDSAFVAYSQEHGLPLEKQTSVGGNIGLLYDTRDNSINASRGWLANVAYRTFFKALGSDSTWQEVAVDVRTYKRLNASGSQRVAFWLMSDMVAGGVAPYFDLPTTGGDVRSGRGYSEGRYRGEHLVYGEVEYRGSLVPSGMLGFVAFLNSSTIGSADAGTKLFESYAPAAGFGLRVLLNKHSRTNFTTDWAWGKEGSRGFYLGIQEAF